MRIYEIQWIMYNNKVPFSKGIRKRNLLKKEFVLEIDNIFWIKCEIYNINHSNIQLFEKCMDEIVFSVQYKSLS